MWVTAKECVGLPDLPAMEHNIRHRLTKAASGNTEWLRRREGTKAIEFKIDCLPYAAQQVLRERYVAQLMENEPQEPVKPVVRRRRDPDAISPLEAYRGSPLARRWTTTCNCWR